MEIEMKITNSAIDFLKMISNTEKMTTENIARILVVTANPTISAVKNNHFFCLFARRLIKANKARISKKVLPKSTNAVVDCQETTGFE